ncbi:MAG: crossover junction endodeoxyribonuclease RuvC, partial [Thermodesulfovibrionales bacterium]|nr:crossover junction endodeoxyribonuclease RuvC [Thermodesulfovibrionales bacterium]
MRRQEKNKSRIILGIDPGSIVCGYGIIKTAHPEQLGINSNTDTVYVASGRIMLPSKQPLSVRLKELYSNLTDIIREYSPHEVAIEKVF